MKTIDYFNNTTGKMHATDPCYDIEDNNMSGVNIHVHKGKWVARVKYTKNSDLWGSRPIALEIEFDEGYSLKNSYSSNYEIGVDSGQFGFFDTGIYIDPGNYEDETGFYRKCCYETIYNAKKGKIDQWGIIDNLGVVSESGYGDGSYPLTILYDENHVAVKMLIEFGSDVEEDNDTESFDDIKRFW